MTNFLKGAAIGAIGMYIAGAFVLLNFNALEWTEPQRFTIVMIAACGGIVSLMVSKK